MRLRRLLFGTIVSVGLSPIVSTAQTTLLRGPYLQAATDTSVHIRWRTDAAEAGRVQWGTSAGNLSFSKSETASANDHEIILTGLTANTKYWYAIGNANTVLQGDAANYFQTLPIKGSKGLLRIGVIGDCGNNSVNQMNVRDGLQAYLGSSYMNAWLLLGDNAYSYGLDAEYQSAFFNIYKDKFLKQSPLYPSPGNHDYSDNSTYQDNHQIPYYANFSMPINGEAGGTPSHNPAYYSYDVGNVHFLSLDAFGREDNSTRLYDTLGKQVQWIKQDLAANQNKDWIIAYWHHAPFSLGSRNGETEADMTAIRTNFIRILERYGVDLILCGHSHDYERSKLQKGFYGYEAEFNPSLHNLSSSSALYDGSANACPYVKDSTNAGTVYVVAGSGGQLGGTQAGYPHDAMYYSNASVGGAIMLEIEEARLDAKWICSDGIIRDKFTVMKGVNKKKTVSINAGDNVTLTASYIGTYNWSTGSAATKSITVSPTTNTTYYVSDAYGCLRDTFVVNVSNVPLPLTWISVKASYDKATHRALISWQTQDEKSIHHFEVERSVDNNFISIGKVAATGNASSASYSFTDATLNSAQAFYYYRIKQVGDNGAVSYSPTIKLNLNNSNDFDVQVMPNPSHGSEVKIRLLNAAFTMKAEVVVADASGKIVESKTLLLQASPQPFLSEAEAGTYFVTVKTDAFVRVLKVVVQ